MVDLESVEKFLTKEPLTVEHAIYKFKNLKQLKKIIANVDDYYIGTEHDLSDADVSKMINSNVIDYKYDRLLVTHKFFQGEHIGTDFSLIQVL